MTSKHFEAIADGFEQTRTRRVDFVRVIDFDRAYAQWSHDLRMVARTFETFDPRFDLFRFERAAGATGRLAEDA